jgi:hypothetical protein
MAPASEEVNLFLAMGMMFVRAAPCLQPRPGPLVSCLLRACAAASRTQRVLFPPPRPP